MHNNTHTLRPGHRPVPGSFGAAVDSLVRHSYLRFTEPVRQPVIVHFVRHLK
jgi:hypothetical protein